MEGGKATKRNIVVMKRKGNERKKLQKNENKSEKRFSYIRTGF
jgi:hypothetical protein